MKKYILLVTLYLPAGTRNSKALNSSTMSDYNKSLVDPVFMKYLNQFNDGHKQYFSSLKDLHISLKIHPDKYLSGNKRNNLKMMLYHLYTMEPHVLALHLNIWLCPSLSNMRIKTYRYHNLQHMVDPKFDPTHPDHLGGRDKSELYYLKRLFNEYLFTNH